MKSVKLLAPALLVLVVFAGALAAQTNPEQPRFSVTIKALKSEVTLGSDIDIAITTTNLTDETLIFQFGRHGNVADGFEYDVRDEQGAPVAKHEEHRTKHLANGEIWHIPSPTGRSMLGRIRPGESSGRYSTISDIYKFDHPGKYTIQVSQKESGSLVPIYSNTITVTVVIPAPAADAAK